MHRGIHGNLPPKVVLQLLLSHAARRIVRQELGETLPMQTLQAISAFCNVQPLSHKLNSAAAKKTLDRFYLDSHDNHPTLPPRAPNQSISNVGADFKLYSVQTLFEALPGAHSSCAGFHQARIHVQTIERDLPTDRLSPARSGAWKVSIRPRPDRVTASGHPRKPLVALN